MSNHAHRSSRWRFGVPLGPNLGVSGEGGAELILTRLARAAAHARVVVTRQALGNGAVAATAGILLAIAHKPNADHVPQNGPLGKPISPPVKLNGAQEIPVDGAKFLNPTKVVGDPGRIAPISYRWNAEH